MADTQIAMFGAGCFWGVEAAYRRVKGVKATAVGYAGGSTDKPSYEAVCRGDTGHAEVVRIEFDPDEVSYDALLDALWEVHDPTTMNRQGPDVGTQYRSAIFTMDEAQAETARASKAALDASGLFGAPVVTEITPASEFWMAEDYHQQYFEKQRGGARRWF